MLLGQHGGSASQGRIRRDMETKSALKVGILVLVGLALGIIFYTYLSHFNPNTYKVTIHFDDTKGLGRQSLVRMQGVNIGEVSDIQLDTMHTPIRPTVVLLIDRKFKIPSNAEFLIVSGILITTAQIEVHVPDMPAGQALTYLPSDDTAVTTGSSGGGTLASLSPELQQAVSGLGPTIKDFQSKFDALSVKLSKLVDHTDTLVGTSTETIKSAKMLVSSPRIQQDLPAMVSNFRATSENAKTISRDLSQQLGVLLKLGRGKLDKLSNAAIDLTLKLGNTIDEARLIVKTLTEQASDPRLQQSLQETIELARSTLASVRQITSDLHQITGDPTLKRNLTDTVSNFNKASQTTNEILEKTNSLLGKVTRATGRAKGPKLPTTLLRANLSQQLNPGRFRFDMDARFELGKRGLLDLGVYDLGESSRLDLQLGNRFTDATLVRYGIYAGKLGVGGEYLAPNGLGLRADLYDPNHLRLDVRGLIRVNKNASVWVGAQGIFRDARPAIGVQLTP